MRVIPEEWKERYEFYCRETQPFAIQMKLAIERIADLSAENAELTRKGQELCSAYGNALVTIHDLNTALDLCDIHSQVANGHIGSPVYKKICAIRNRSKEPKGATK